MGNCFGKCLPTHEEVCSTFNILPNSSSDLTYIDKVSFCDSVGINTNLESSTNESKKSSFLSRFFNKRKIKTKKPVLQLVDGLLHHQNNFYCRLKEPSLPSAGSSRDNDIQLHSLDVRALLPHTTQSSPTLSLDLEWEHESIPFFMAPDYSDNSSKIMSSDSRPGSESSTRSMMPMCPTSECSQPSSANSLEWDSLCPASPQVSEVDTDTQILLGEIERLTRQTLLETGQEYLPS